MWVIAELRTFKTESPFKLRVFLPCVTVRYHVSRYNMYDNAPQHTVT